MDNTKKEAILTMILKSTLRAMMLVTIVVVPVWLISCVDVSSTGPTPPDFNSEFRFLNAAADLGNVSISFDLGDAVSVLGFGAANSHQTYPSGNRIGALSSGDSLRVAMTAEQRATVVILPLTGTVREFIKMIERRIFDSAATSGARIRVAHAGLAGAAEGGDLDVTIAGADTSLTVMVSYRDVSGYASVPAGSYTLTAMASGDTVAVATTTVDLSSARYTSVITGDVSAPSFVDLSDN
jgi:hypothetical protein